MARAGITEQVLNLKNQVGGGGRRGLLLTNLRIRYFTSTPAYVKVFIVNVYHEDSHLIRCIINNINTI